MLRTVGLNLLYLIPQEVGGTEVYARRLVAALAALRPDVRFIAYCGQEAAEVLPGWDWPANVTIHPLPVRARVKPLRAAAELGLLPFAAARAGAEVLHSLGTTSPLAGRQPRVVTVHDLIYEHFPDTFPAAARLGLRALVGAGARRSNRVIAISESVKRDIVERLGLDPARVDVVHNGLGTPPSPRATARSELQARLRLGDRPLVLCVSAALEHKNLPRLVEAVGRLERPAPSLVIVGHAGRDTPALRQLIERHGLGDRVRLTGWVSDEDLEGLYAMADVFAYPSLHEGFGLPVLEAMRRGVPVACSDSTSLPEVAGDAAELFDPLVVDAIAAAVRRLLSEPAHAARLVARGAERPAHFSWERCARGVLASYELAVGG